MTLVDGRWDAGPDTGDFDRFDNWFTVEDLPRLVDGTAFDLVIVGAGGAGAAAAIEASDRGATVLVLEKAEHAGGSTHVSGGTVRLIDDPEGAVEHYLALSQGTTPREVIQAFVDGLAEIPDWIAAHGGVLTDDVYAVARDGSDIARRRVFPAARIGSAFPNFPHSDAMGPRMHVRPQRPDRIWGAAMWDFLRSALAATGAPVVTGARVVALLQEAPGLAVRGVRVATPAGPVDVTAKHGVVLAAGGFAWDPALQRDYFGIDLPAMSPPERNTGDGIRLAQSAGADLWHMTATSTTIGYKFPELTAALACEVPVAGFVMVDQEGRRYARETLLETHSFTHPMLYQDPLTGRFLRTPSYIVLDEKTRVAGPLSSVGLGYNRRYPWSPDNSAEIERGWILRADSIEELAAKLGLPADSLSATIDAFNAYATRGETDEFGRPASEMIPIDTPPYYGVAVYPSLLNTQGGPRRDGRGRVLRPDGTAIPGLYSAGELGSIWSRLYPGGGNVSEALVSGRAAAITAIAEAAVESASIV